MEQTHSNHCLSRERTKQALKNLLGPSNPQSHKAPFRTTETELDIFDTGIHAHNPSTGAPQLNKQGPRCRAHALAPSDLRAPTMQHPPQNDSSKPHCRSLCPKSMLLRWLSRRPQQPSFERLHQEHTAGNSEYLVPDTGLPRPAALTCLQRAHLHDKQRASVW